MLDAAGLKNELIPFLTNIFVKNFILSIGVFGLDLDLKIEIRVN